MRNFKNIALTFFCAITFAGASAQTLSSSYFLEGMPMRHKLNPALVGRNGYFSIPFLGNVNMKARSTMALNHFLYPGANDQLVTMFHPSISSAKALSKVRNRNAAVIDFDYTLASMGFFSNSGYYTVDLSLRSTSGANVPGDLFRFMKLGMDKAEGSHYNIKDLRFETSNYMELAVGNSRRITDELTVGAKVKILLGIADTKAEVSNMDIYMTKDKWSVNAYGNLNGAMKGAVLERDIDGTLQGVDEFGNPVFGGWGLGLDLGATYRFSDNLTFSASATDIGFISWKRTVRGEMNGDPFVFDGFDDIAVNDNSSPNSIENQIDQLGDDLENLFKFQELDAKGRYARSLKSVIRLGAEYSLTDLDNKISFGLLSTTRFGMSKTFTEMMGTVNFRPWSVFEASINGSVSNYGTSWGWLLNLCPDKVLNFYVGMDYMISRVTPQYVPIGRASLSVNFGLSVPIGPRICRGKVFTWENINYRD